MSDPKNIADHRVDSGPTSFSVTPDDAKALRDSIADAASVSNTLWITYMGTLFYLLISVGSVTHKDLFLQSSMTLPFMNIDLPTAGFFWLGPYLFLILHAYVLLHFVILTDKIATLDQAIAMQVAGQEALRWELPVNILVQFLAGPSKVRDGMTGVFLWLIALVTLVISPVLLLLFFELRFLPYHSGVVTWAQRIAVGIDLGLLWLFWPRIALRKSDAAQTNQMSRSQRIQRVWTTRTMWILTLTSPALVLLIATFPGEELHKLSSEIPGESSLIDGELDKESLLPESLLSSRLMLPKFDAVRQAKLDSQEKLDYATETVIIQGRQLRGANLKLADLRKANLIADDLTDADLGSANLTNARLDLAHLGGAKLDFVNLTDAVLTNATLTGADLTGANLTGANLTGANLSNTKVGQTQLDKACGDGVVLSPDRTIKPCTSPR